MDHLQNEMWQFLFQPDILVMYCFSCLQLGFIGILKSDFFEKLKLLSRLTNNYHT